LGKALRRDPALWRLLGRVAEQFAAFDPDIIPW